MGYHRIILIVGVVICRAAVLQVFSTTTSPASDNTRSSAATTTASTTQPDAEQTTTVLSNCEDIFKHCSSCIISDSGLELICTQCEEKYHKQDNESCVSYKDGGKNEACCLKKIPWALIGGVVGGIVVLILLVLTGSICYCYRRKKRSRAEPPRPPPVNTNTVHTDTDGTRYRFDAKGNRVYIRDVEMDNRPPMGPPLDVPHPPLRAEEEDFGQVYDNDPEQGWRGNTSNPRSPPPLPGQFQLPKPPLPKNQRGLPIDEPPRPPPPVPGKAQPPNPPPKPATSQGQSRSKPPPTPLKPKPKPVVPRQIDDGNIFEHVSNQPSHQPDFEETYQIPDAENGEDYGGTYDDVAAENDGFDWQESYDDVSSPSHQDRPESDGEDYEDVPKPSFQSLPQNILSNITQEQIIRDYGDDKLYQNQPVLDAKTKTSYRYRNLAMTKGEKIESEIPYLVKR